ncbi:MAG: sugar-binding domain-containing protein [Lutisporaceae bacterium]
MNTREDLLIRAAELYYQQGLSQNAIAEILCTSRPTVSRILEEARELGIIEIIIHSPIKKNAELSKSLRTAFNLKDAIVVSGSFDYDTALQKCSTAAAHFLNSILENNNTIGISWGPAINYLCDSIEPHEYYNINVIQMVGCLGTGNPSIDGLELAMKISGKLKGTYSNIYAPAFVDNETVYSYLIAEPQIESTLKKALNVDIVLTGIGSLYDSASTLQRSGYLTENERQNLLSKGGVGHLLARIFDANGNEIPIEGKYVISTPLDALRSPKWSIGICASEMKAISVLAAIRAGYINTLISDEALANKLLKLNSDS